MFGRYLTVDFQNGRLGVVQQVFDLGVQAAVLRQQLAHVLCATTRRGLVRHGAHPFHQPRFVQRPHAHEHATDRAVATHPVVATLGHGRLNHVQVDGVKNNDCIIFHTQGRRRVNPVASPASRAQLGEHLAGVVATLRGDDDVAPF